MKKPLVVGLALMVAALAAAEEGFWQQLTADERAAAGLEQLTPEQQAALDRLAKRFASEGARRAAEAAKAEAKVEAREAVKASLGLSAPAEDQVIRSRIKGTFKGWTYNQLFTLENGQRWKVVDKESRWFPARTDPEVQIEPGMLNSWKLRIVAEGLWVRVRRVE